MGREHGVVRLNDSRGDLRAGVDAEVELGLLAVVDGQTLEQEGAKARARATTDGVEDEEALETSALVGKLANSVKDKIDDLLADSVVAMSVVVGSILLASDELFRVEQLAVGASADLIDHSRFQVDEDSTRDVLASAGLREEGVERIITIADGLIAGHLAIGLDAVLKSEELPASVTGLDTSLTNVD